MVSTRLPILTFHALDYQRDVIACPPGVFTAGMEMLLDAGHRAVALAEVAELIRLGAPLPEKGFALSFDDGYRSVFEHAFPVIERYGIPATVFVATGPGKLDPDGCLPGREGRPMLGWAQVREMQASGIEIGAHTRSHSDLTRLPAATAEAEMAGSQAAIEDLLGRRVGGFSYPFGRFDDSTRAIASRLFDYAVSDRLALVDASSDVLALERIEMMYFRSERRLRLLRHASLPNVLRAVDGARRLRRLLSARA